MAGGGQVASVVVNFDAKAYDDNIRLEISNKKPPDDKTVYVRVHGGEGYALVSTSGTFTVDTPNLRRYTEEFVYMNDNGIAPLTYPDAQDVDITPFGNFVYANGTTVAQSNLVFDPVINSVTSTPSGIFGVMKVTYKAPYDLYKAIFSGSCPEVFPYDPPQDGTKGSADDDEISLPGRTPMMVYAIKDQKIGASLFVEPPPCSYPTLNFSGINRTKGMLPKLVAEIDDNYPIALLSTSATPQLRAGCRIRVYPAITSGLSFAVTRGSMIALNNSIDRPFSEAVSFNGDPSTQLNYQPKAGTSVGISPATGDFIDIWGMTFSASNAVRTPGQDFNAVQWLDRKTYGDSVVRTTMVDELVVVDMFGNSRPAYGSVIADYITTYTQFDYLFDYDVSEGWFAEASATFKYQDQVATIPLPPPRRRGN